MSRIFNQTNVWGSQGGIDAQRADLWTMDFSLVLKGLNEQITQAGKFGIETDLGRVADVVEPYFIQSVTMPTLKVKADEFRRDSRPMMMPGYDEALPEIKVVFMVETTTNSDSSKIYRFMETWRAFVRAGRGATGGEKTVSLGKNFTVEFRYPVMIVLKRGCENPVFTAMTESLTPLNNTEYYGNLGQLQESLDDLPDEQSRLKRLKEIRQAGGVFGDVTYMPLTNDLVDCAIFMVEKMWLSSFKLTDLDYSKGNELVKLEATFYADNILDLQNKKP